MRKVLYPPTWVLSISIALVGVVALTGIAFGVWALQRTADQAARAEAQNAKNEAVAESSRRSLESQCRILDVLRVKPGDAQPSTPRGKEQAAAVAEEYRRLGCQ